MERIELPQADLEAAVLPLYYTEVKLGADSQVRTDDIFVGNETFYH